MDMGCEDHFFRVRAGGLWEGEAPLQSFLMVGKSLGGFLQNARCFLHCTVLKEYFSSIHHFSHFLSCNVKMRPRRKRRIDSTFNLKWPSSFCCCYTGAACSFSRSTIATIGMGGTLRKEVFLRINRSKWLLDLGG